MTDSNDAGLPDASVSNAGTDDKSADTALTVGNPAETTDQQGQAAQKTETALTEGDDNGDSDGEGEGEANELTGAPEADYEAFEIPEGIQVNEEGLTEFKTLAKELNLSQKGAQRLVDFQMQMNARQAEQAVQAYQDQQTEWLKALKSDPEIGGNDFAKKQAQARKVVEKYADDDFKQRYSAWDAENNPNGTGLGNDPVLVRMFYKIAQDVLPDDPPSGNRGDAPQTEKSRVERLYGTK